MTQPQRPSIDHGSIGERAQWTVALRTQPRDALLRIAESVSERFEAKHQSLPKSGLAMMQLRDSVIGEAFNLGEITLSTARVQLTSMDGRVVEGAASVMADDAELATALAVCDAVLAEKLDGWEDIGILVKRGLEQLEETDRMRRAILNRSRVDFSLLNQDE